MVIIPNTNSTTVSEIWDILREVPDPEVPVLSVVDLGIIRHVEVTKNSVEITITPTYSGCPAMKTIEDDIVFILKKKGIPAVKIISILSPAWTTDWISEEAKEKLRKYGIAPPGKTTTDKGVLSGKTLVIPCPICSSSHTELISQFGSTACKALYRCLDCKEPFDYFKCH